MQVWNEIGHYLTTKLIRYMGDSKGIIGISGGIDSAVVGKMGVNAVGAERMTCLWMPYGDNAKGYDRALAVSTWLGVPLKTVDIKPAVDAAIASLGLGDVDKVTKGNMMARQRMCVLYAHANAMGNTRVLGTGNSTEIALGYGTKFGDEACDVQPIGELLKCEVRAVAATMTGIPPWVITQAPSADLWEGQTDEGEIGMTYNQIDSVLSGLNEDPVLESKVRDRFVGSAHKRATPPILHLSDKISFEDQEAGRREILGYPAETQAEA